MVYQSSSLKWLVTGPGQTRMSSMAIEVNRRYLEIDAARGSGGSPNRHPNTLPYAQQAGMSVRSGML
jgi:hypothetical protein